MEKEKQFKYLIYFPFNINIIINHNLVKMIVIDVRSMQTTSTLQQTQAADDNCRC